MKTLHVETGRHLYGGPQQVLYLLGALRDEGVGATLVCPPASDIAAAAREKNIDVREIDCGGDLDLRFVWRLRAVLRELKPDLVHCHSRRGADMLGGQAAAMESIPAVVSRRVDNPEPGLLASLRYRKFARIVAISNAIRDVLIDTGVTPERIEVIRSTVDTARFAHGQTREAMLREFDLPDDARVIASGAQFIERKGHRYLLEAAALLRGSMPQLRVLLFGKGPLEAELRRLSADLSLDACVQFVGFRDDLDDYLGTFDLLVHTALAEGLGVITLKAAAAGLPVVAFAAGGVKEAVADGESGVLVAPGDSQALASALGALLHDNERREAYARNSRRHAEQFSIAAMVAAHLRLYRDIVSGGAQ